MNSKIKILYVGFTEIGDNDATGITLKNIFDGWSDVDIMQYSLDYSSEKHLGKGKKVYVDKYISPTYYLIKSIYRKRTNCIGYSGIEHSESTTNSAVSLGKAILDIIPKRLSTKSRKIISEFNPDIIYTLAENISDACIVNS